MGFYSAKAPIGAAACIAAAPIAIHTFVSFVLFVVNTHVPLYRP
jgi:hypothetical protein